MKNSNTTKTTATVKTTATKVSAALTSALTSLSAQIETINLQIGVLKSLSTLTDNDKKVLGDLTCKADYKAKLLNLPVNVQEFIVKHNDEKLTDIARNIYGKTVYFASLAVTGKPICFEQSAYAAQFLTRIVCGKKLTTDFTFTGRDLALSLGSICEITGKPKGMSTSTQPYAVIAALESLTGAKRTKGAQWKTTSFTLKADSALVKGFNTKALV